MCSVLEVCVDSTASALAAKRGGADRLELCADLIVGGTTPSLTLVQQVKAETGLPVRALLRPRFGDFCYDSYELAQMEQLAAELVEAGADGIVTGVLTPEGAAGCRRHAAHLCGGTQGSREGGPSGGMYPAPRF
ncbi:MAG: copper homeostasis protein CutC [Faecalibacterium sp.]